MSMSPVRQPFHIFRKDAIHLWPETLVSLALLVGYAYMQSKSWPTAGDIDPAPIASALLAFLVPISWLTLVSRLVHDEELVGDRQFWTTRPYTWYGLLAAKVLYLVVFILLPLVLTQAWMLHHAGLYPTHLLPGLLSSLKIVTFVVLLPLLAIAAVTATFIRYISSVIGAIIYLIVVVLFVLYTWGQKVTTPFLEWPMAIIVLGLILAALLVQYARRKTLIARLLLLAVPLAFALVFAVLPANWLTGHRYPENNLGQLAFVPGVTPPDNGGPVLVLQHRVFLQLPVNVTLPADPHRAYLEAQVVRTTIDGPNGLHVVTDWLPLSTTFGARPTAIVAIALPSDVFDKIRNQPVALHITLGTQTYTAGTPYTVAATEASFPIPDHSYCKLKDGVLNCTSPFSDPAFTHISATVHDGECSSPGTQTAPVEGVLTGGGAGLGLSPVKVNKIEFGFGRQQVGLCPNTPVTFHAATPGPYARLQLDIPSITLDPYARRVPPKTSQNAPAPPQQLEQQPEQQQ